MTAPVFYASGNSGSDNIWKRDINGIWSKISATLSVVIHVNAVWGASENDVWFGGYDNGIPNTTRLVHFNGTSFSGDFPVPGMLHNSNRITSLHGFSSNEIYGTIARSTGDDGYLIKWDGVSWAIIHTLAGFVPSGARGGYQVHGQSGNDLWIGRGGNPGQHPIVGHWNGTTLTQADNPDYSDNGRPFGHNNGTLITFPSGDVLVAWNKHAFGSGVFPNHPRGLNVVSGPKGATNIRWDLLDNVDDAGGSQSQYVAISATSQNDIWIAGEGNVSQSPILRHYDGNTWHFESIASTDGILNAVYAVTPTAIVATSRVHPTVGVQFYDGNNWVNEPLPGAVGNQPLLAVWGFLVVTEPPFLQNLDPARDEEGIDSQDNIVLEIVDLDSDITESSITIVVEDVTVWNNSAPQAGWTIVESPVVGPDGYRFVMTPPKPLPLGLVKVDATATNVAAQTMVDSYIFNTFRNIPRPIHRLNQFDEHGSLLSLVRLREEKNWEYKRRINDTAVHLANSSYRGLIHGITRELGLSLYDAISINPKTSSPQFQAVDPLIKFDGSWLLLYSDFANNILDWAIDRFQPGGNHEHLNRLVDFINTTNYFEASIKPGVDPFSRSMTILNQSNRAIVRNEKVPASTKFNLGNDHITPGTLVFTNRSSFRNEVASELAVIRKGDYYVDYVPGIVTVFTIPTITDTVRYQYTTYPFVAKASPIILHDINSDNFRVKMFQQVLQDNGTFVHGLPTEIGVDIINELMSVIPIYWGV